MANAPTEQTLLSWDVVHHTRPVIKGIGAALGWGNSLATTILCCVWFQQLATRTEEQPNGTWTWLAPMVGFCLWLALTAGQIWTANAHTVANIAFTAPDALMTGIPWSFALVWFFTVLLGPVAGFVLGIPAAWYLGIISARAPERLVFGKRPAGDRPLWLRTLFF